MSQPDKSKFGESQEPFDGFDDVAEGITEPHPHPPIPDIYSKKTGRGLAFTVLIVTVALAGAYLYVNHIKARAQAELTAATEAKLKEPPTVEVISVALAPASQPLRLPGGTLGLVPIVDLRTSQRVYHEVACRYRRQGQKGSGSRYYRHARTRRPARSRARAAQGSRGGNPRQGSRCGLCQDDFRPLARIGQGRGVRARAR